MFKLIFTPYESGTTLSEHRRARRRRRRWHQTVTGASVIPSPTGSDGRN